MTFPLEEVLVLFIPERELYCSEAVFTSSSPGIIRNPWRMAATLEQPSKNSGCGATNSVEPIRSDQRSPSSESSVCAL
jgi:hypothetical protein